jgi:hypothetical protein
MKLALNLSFVIACACLSTIMARENESRMLEFFAARQYREARKIALSLPPENPVARLIHAEALLYDRGHQDLKNGLAELASLAADRAVPEEVRAQAALAQTRVSHVMHRRGQTAGADYQALYTEIMENFPANNAAAFAAIYLAEWHFENERQNEGIKGLENFLLSFQGDKRALGAIHNMLADAYIAYHQDYAQAVKHLEEMWQNGIFNPKNREKISFRKARIYDFRLHDKERAKAAYKDFLSEFPNSAGAAAATRHLAEME